MFFSASSTFCQLKSALLVPYLQEAIWQNEIKTKSACYEEQCDQERQNFGVLMTEQEAGKNVSSPCEICLAKTIQEKMATLLLHAPSIKSEEDTKTISRCLIMLKTRSEEIILFIQIILKIKVELAFARLDLERALKSDNQVETARGRVHWLQHRLHHFSESCQASFLGVKKELYAENNNDDNSSSRLKNILHQMSNSFVDDKVCTCNLRDGGVQEKALEKLRNDVQKVLHCQDDKINQKASESKSTKKEKLLDEMMNENGSDSLISINNKNSTVKNDDFAERDYWQQDHHRRESVNFQQKMNPVSWHNLSLTYCDSFLERRYAEKQGISPEIPWKEKPKFSSIIDYHKIALDRLVGKLFKIFDHVEDAAFATADKKNPIEKDLKETENVKNQHRLPKIKSKGPVFLVKSEVEHNENVVVLADSPEEPLSSNHKIKEKRAVFPQSPSVWCEEVFPDAVDLINHKKRPKSSLKSASVESSRSGSKNLVSFPAHSKDKKSTMKRAVVRVRAVAKIKRQFCPSTLSEESVLDGVKLNRINDLIGTLGLWSGNKTIAVHAAKALGQLKCKDEMVITELANVIKLRTEGLLVYECAKAMLLLGVWKESAITVITDRLCNGCVELQLDVLSNINKSPNAQFVSKNSKHLTNLSNALRSLLLNSDERLSFGAAMCLGHLCIFDVQAKNLLLSHLKQDSYSVKDKALSVLIKQMNCKDDVAIDVLLHQISHAYSWKHRLNAANLLVFVGLRRVRQYGYDTVFKVLHELLWNHPNKEFRSKIAAILTDFGMKDEACSITMRRLEDKNETVRAEAIIALATLGMNGHKELKMLLDIFDLDSSCYVRTQVIRAFVGLRWNHPNVIKALQERQKGDDALAREATKALKVLTSC